MITVTLSNLTQEDLRLLIAALRDKREQMLETERRFRFRASQTIMTAEKQDLEETASRTGEQAHRMAGLVDQLQTRRKELAAPKAELSVAEDPA